MKKSNYPVKYFPWWKHSVEVFDQPPPHSLPTSLPIKVRYLPHDSNSLLMIIFSKHENILMNNNEQ